MNESNISRRDFLYSTAVLSASAAVTHAATIATTEIADGQPTSPEASGEKEVAMVSVFPAGPVYFRKSNPPSADWAKDHKAI